MAENCAGGKRDYLHTAQPENFLWLDSLLGLFPWEPGARKWIQKTQKLNLEENVLLGKLLVFLLSSHEDSEEPFSSAEPLCSGVQGNDTVHETHTKLLILPFHSPSYFSGN